MYSVAIARRNYSAVAAAERQQRQNRFLRSAGVLGTSYAQPHRKSTAASFDASVGYPKSSTIASALVSTGTIDYDFLQRLIPLKGRYALHEVFLEAVAVGSYRKFMVYFRGNFV